MLGKSSTGAAGILHIYRVLVFADKATLAGVFPVRKRMMNKENGDNKLNKLVDCEYLSYLAQCAELASICANFS